MSDKRWPAAGQKLVHKFRKTQGEVVAEVVSVDRITDNGDWQGWIEFFLKAIQSQAVQNTDKAKQIHALYNEMKARFAEVTRSQYALAALDSFFSRPIINSSDFISLSGIENRGTANTLLRGLHEADLVCVIREASGRRPAIYALPTLINISEGRDVF